MGDLEESAEARGRGPDRAPRREPQPDAPGGRFSVRRSIVARAALVRLGARAVAHSRPRARLVGWPRGVTLDLEARPDALLPRLRLAGEATLKL